jgi:outer membrane protein assembly factor BamB
MNRPRSSPLPLFGAALLGATFSVHAALDWPQFRGPDANGITSAKNLPLEWSATKGVAWSVEIPGKGWSSPVLSDGKLYLTAAVSDATEEVGLNVLCLDQASGKVLWNKEVFRPDPGEAKAMHKKNTAASPTPIIAGGKIYVHFGHMGTAALDLQGTVLWRQNSLKYKPVHGTGGSPVLVGDSLIFGADGREEPFIAALDARTGEVRWQKPRNTAAKKQFSFSTPAVIQVGGVSQVVSPHSGFVAAYNPADGTEFWKVAYGEGYSVVPRPVYAHGLLYLSSGFDAAALYAIRPEGAKADATATAVAWTLKKGAPHTPSVVVVGSDLFCVSDAGIASCVDALTGAVHWSERLAGNYSASPIAAGDRVYFLNETGVTSVVKAAQKFELLATNELGERTLASPAPADGALFIRGETHLFKLVP